MYTRKVLLASILVVSIGIFPSFSQSEQEDNASNSQSEKDGNAASLAKELANPNATRGQLFNNFDYVRYDGNVPNAGQNGFVYSFQPSLPVPLSEGVNLFVRPLIPIYLSQPVIGTDGFENVTSFGNISVDVAVGKTWPSKWMTLVGVFAGFPTAGNEELRSNFTTMGPEIVVGKATSWGFVGIMVNHAWSISSNDPDPESFTILSDSFWTNTAGREKASVTAGQYFYTVNLKNGWQIQGTPTWAYNHEATDGNKFTFPIGTGVTKVTHFGKLPIKFNLQYWYYVASPDSFGPQQQIRLSIVPVINLPW